MFTSVVLPHLLGSGGVWNLERLDSIKQETDALLEQGGWDATAVERRTRHEEYDKRKSKSESAPASDRLYPRR